MDLHKTVISILEELYQTIRNEASSSFPSLGNETQPGLVITELSRSQENQQLLEVHSETTGDNEMAVETSAGINLAIEDIDLIEKEIKKLEDVIQNQSQRMEEEISHIKNRLSSMELGSKAIDCPGTSAGILVSPNSVQHQGKRSDSHVRIITPKEMEISSESHKFNNESNAHQKNFATRTPNSNLSAECSLDEGKISGNTDDFSGVRSISKSSARLETSTEKKGQSTITARSSETIRTISDSREPVRISTETDTIQKHHETIPGISTGTTIFPKSTSYSESPARTGKLSSQSCTNVKSLDEGPISEHSLSGQRSLDEGPISEYSLSGQRSSDEGPISENSLLEQSFLDEGPTSEYILSNGKSLEEGPISENYFSGEISLDEGKITDSSIYSKKSSIIRSVSNISRTTSTSPKAESVSISCVDSTSATETGKPTDTSSIPISTETSAQMEEAKSPAFVDGICKGIQTIPKTLISPKSPTEKRTILKSENGHVKKSTGKTISGPCVPIRTGIEMDKISKPFVPQKIIPKSCAGTSSPSKTVDATAWPQSVDRMVHNYSNGNKLHIQIDMSEYIPKEIYVDVIEDRLLVQARKSAEKRERSIKKEFNYHMYLPEGTRREHVKKFLTKDGILIIQGILPNIIIKQ